MEANLQKENIEDVYPMSDIQLGMVYHSLKAPDTSIYHNQMVFQIKDRDFKPEILKKASLLMVEKHPILRTGFNIYGFKEPIQIVFKTITPDIHHHDISHLDKAEQEEQVKSILSQDRKRKFNLTTPEPSQPLWRMRTFALDKKNIFFIWACHHAILDGWSSASLMTELNNTYLQLKSHPYFVPKKLKNTYKEFVIKQMIEKKKPETINYWKRELEGYKRFEFPAAPGNSQEPGEPGTRKVYETRLGKTILDKLNNAAVKHDTSLKHLCLGAYIYMLNMLSYEGDIVVGLVTNNRPACEDGEKILGCFLNTVPVRVKILPHIKWSDYIRMMDKKLKELTEYNRLSLYEIARGAGVEIQNQNPIFDTLFSFVDFHVYKGLNRQELQNTGQYGFDRELSIAVEPTTNTLLDFTVDITSECLGIALSYSNSLANDEMVKKCCRYFENILDKFIHDSDMLIEKDQLMSLEEKKKLLYEFNDTAAGYPKDKTIHSLFAEQAARTPANTALVFENHHLTYEELDKRAHGLAALLIETGVVPDTIVGIMDRSLEMIIGILGILKAGGAYLPIDPEYPNERIGYMLSDSSTDIVLKRKNMFAGISFAGKQICLDNRDVYNGKTTPLDMMNKPSHLIYIIYTSGSTGKPKGVMVEHINVVRLFFNDKFQFDFNEKDIWTMFHSPCFDFSVWEMYGALLYGGKLIIIPKTTAKDQFEYYKILQNEKVTILNQTPSAFYQLMNEELIRPKNQLNLKYIIFGGEALGPLKLKEWKKRYPCTTLVNMFGITETTVHVTYKKIEDREIRLNHCNIGKPIPTLSTYVVDNNLRLLPMGAAGELCVAGQGTARGYINRPALTYEKFVKNPDKPGERLYRSGDMVRLLQNGDMEYLGRIDHQVKVRGFRIELGEIECQLLNFSQIKEAVVMKGEYDSGDGYLCAYIVPGKKLKTSELREYLSVKLPDYMIPSYFVQLEKIPLTSNGKLDKRALDAYDRNISTGSEYVDPESEMEKRIANIWKEVLNVDKVGIYDNFFDLGGNSITVMRLNNRLNQALGTRIPVVKMFNYVTVSSFVEYLGQKETEKSPSGKGMVGAGPRDTGAKDRAKHKRKKQKTKRRKVERINVTEKKPY